MCAITSETRNPDRTSRSRLLRLSLGVLVLLAVFTVGVVYWARRTPPPPEPPFVPLDGLETPVAVAIEQARQRVRQSPHSSTAWGRLGMLLGGHGFRPQAIPCFTLAEQLDPNEPRWPYFLGLTLRFEARDLEAIPPLRRAARLCPSRPDAPRLQLAKQLLKEGQLDEAEEHFRALLADNPGHGPAHLGLARLALSRGDASQARASLRGCLDNPSVRKAGYALLAEVEQQSGHTKAAATALRRAANLPSDQAWPDPFQAEIPAMKMDRRTRVQLTLKRTAQDQAGEMALGLEDLERDFPGTVPLLEGRACLKDKDYRAAEQNLRIAVEQAPDFPQAHYWLGVALLMQQRVHESADCFRQVLKLQPSHVEARLKLSECQEQQDDRAAAIDTLLAVVGYAPHNAEAHRRLADLLQREGRNDEAALHRKQAISLQADDDQTRARDASKASGGR